MRTKISTAEKREKQRIAMREWCKKNPERHRKNIQDWRARNPERLAQYEKNKRKQTKRKLKLGLLTLEMIKAARRESYVKTWPNPIFASLISAARRKAKTRGFPFALDVAFLRKLYEEQGKVCALSKLPFRRELGKGPSPFSLSLDRIIPSLGYVHGNVRLILNGLNCFKGTGTDEDMWIIITALLKTEKLGGIFALSRK